MIKKLKDTSLHPRAVRPIYGASDAWCYENQRSLDVYITDGTKTLACRIHRAVLEDWIRRTEKEIQP